MTDGAANGGGPCARTVLRLVRGEGEESPAPRPRTVRGLSADGPAPPPLPQGLVAKAELVLRDDPVSLTVPRRHALRIVRGGFSEQLHTEGDGEHQ